tara:strand:+ start:643 stop:1056 length:414 start_codon:yes stop_codon:yes gene_type:complete
VVLLEQAVLLMGFTQSELEAWGPDGIVIQRYEPILGRWLPLTTSIDLDTMAASALTTRFSVFGLTFRQTGAATLSGEPEQIQESTATSGSDPAIPAENSASIEEDDGQISLMTVALIVVVAIGAIGGAGILILRKKN